MKNINTKKGIVLAGGMGTRLYPLTFALSKQLLPVYDKPLIYYPISVLMLANICEILIISNEYDINIYKRLLKTGKQFGVKFEYLVQEKPNGIAEAFIIGENFINNENVALILGDNIFYGNNFSTILNKVQNSNKPTVFAYQVCDPTKFGVIEFDKNLQKIISIEEKPKNPKSNYIVTGMYFYDKNVVNIAKKLKPSKRNELEISDINNIYLKEGNLNAQILGRGFAWLDTGDGPSSMFRASQFVQSIELNQGIKIACLEEIALRNKFISKSELYDNIKDFLGNDYYNYIHKILKTQE